MKTKSTVACDAFPTLSPSLVAEAERVQSRANTRTAVAVVATNEIAVFSRKTKICPETTTMRIKSHEQKKRVANIIAVMPG